MKTLHFYACANREHFVPYESEQPKDLATCQLTEMQVLELIGRYAYGIPPYRLFVPKEILYEAHTWKIPSTLLTVIPLFDETMDNCAPGFGKPTDPASPWADAVLCFDGGGIQLRIHARRCVDAGTISCEKEGA